ncbi:unnamed protein product [Mytilus edulis]|uniref:J domain-containing protein n=1 Tax=Mytilus edulis TaxID=6550 RepID=A0A8S3RMU7_MYTED|nr:unnamed protein product [Mytilus edulis]
MSDFKSVLVKNNTNDYDVILYLYSIHDLLCWISYSSKIVKAGQTYLYRSVNRFQFEIQVNYQQSKKTVVDVRKWEKDVHFTIFDINDVKENDLEDHELEKTICIRKLNIGKEGEINGGRNLYEILNLNFNEIRRLSKEEQDKTIKQAFQREIRRWHSDTAGNLGDHDMARKVILAFDILRDREKRADYHNKANYSEGWLSKSRWKSIFKSEWIQSFLRTFKQKSIEKGCDLGDYGKSFAFGFIGGAITGGAGVGIAAGIVGIGSAATQASAATIGQFVGIGASSAAVGGVSLSLAADAEKKFIDGVDLTWKQVVGHAVVGAVIGAATGSAVGAVSGGVAGISAEVSSTNIDDKLVPGLRKYGVSLSKGLAKAVTNKSTVSVLGAVTGIIEERLDDDLENRPISEHITGIGTNLVVNVLRDVASGVMSTTADHVDTEMEVNRKVNSNDIDIVDSTADVETFNGTVNEQDVDKVGRLDSNKIETESKQHKRQRIRCEIDEMSRLTLADTTVKVKNNQLPDHCVSTDSNGDVYFDANSVKGDSNTEISESKDSSCIYAEPSARFKYISEGLWKSKMIVEYRCNNKPLQKETSGSGTAIEIPIDAEDVKVYFKVMRFIITWCDLKKWDRFENQWFDEPHIFTYECPPEQRTFTISGSLYFERVTHISNEMHDDVNEI